MSFYPKPNVGDIYTSGEKRYKVVSFSSSEVIVVRLNKDNTEETGEITWSENQWNKRNFRNSKADIEDIVDESTKIKTSFTIDIDENGNMIIFKGSEPIKRLNIRGPEGKPGKDGMPGQDGAPGKKGQDGASGQPGKDGAPGEKGQDGKPGKDGAPGPEGKQGKQGPKGKDGVYWYPEISEDSTKLRFRNRDNASDYTEWYNIKGAKGDTGAEGPRGMDGPIGPVFIPSINANGDLSWSNNGGDELKNPPTRNIKGDKGDKGDKGATFHPIVKDGVLYWYDDTGNLVKGITPTRITGEQGEKGEQGAQGLSAYQIWLKQGYRGTEQDFLESLKGEKGSPAPPANFSYKDVDDFKCKVQKINTNLIIDSEEPTDSPEKIINDRIKEIKGLREEGHKKENQLKNRVGWFKKFTWWCAGADQDLLTMCPGDHSKYVGIGTVILFTALMAWFSSFIAMQLVFEVPKDLGFYIIDHGSKKFFTDQTFFGNGRNIAAILFATFWASMIFFLDRFITNTMYSDGKVSISKQEFFSGLPRITIAIFLGIVISAPLELKIFEDAIAMKMDRQLETEKVNEFKTVENDVKSLIKELKSELIQANTKDSIKIVDYRNRLNEIRANKPDAEYDEGSKYIKDGKVLGGGKRETRASRKAREQYDTDNADNISKYNSSILILDDSISKRDKRLLNLETEKNDSIISKRKQIEAKYKNNADRGLKRQLSTLHEIAMEGYEPWWKDDDGKSNFLDTILHSWWWYLFNSAIGLIMLLFILIDISPVLYKMMLADGNYDNYLHQEKLLAQDKIRLSLSNMLKKLNDSELKRVAPFIMGDIYEKMAGDSYIYKTEEEFKEEMAAHKKIRWWWRIWPLSMIRWIFWKEEDKPTSPVIILNSKVKTPNEEAVIKANEEVFDEVLKLKKQIILASYRRWYKTQHDCIICDDVNDENKAREPFDDEVPMGDESKIHIDDNDDK